MAARHVPYRTRRWARREYDRLIAPRVLHEDDPIALLTGRLVVAEPQTTPHAVAAGAGRRGPAHAFGPGWRVRVQLPLALGARSAPEPDVAVVAGGPEMARQPSAPGVRQPPPDPLSHGDEEATTSAARHG